MKEIVCPSCQGTGKVMRQRLRQNNIVIAIDNEPVVIDNEPVIMNNKSVTIEDKPVVTDFWNCPTPNKPKPPVWLEEYETLKNGIAHIESLLINKHLDDRHLYDIFSYISVRSISESEILDTLVERKKKFKEKFCDDRGNENWEIVREYRMYKDRLGEWNATVEFQGKEYIDIDGFGNTEEALDHAIKYYKWNAKEKTLEENLQFYYFQHSNNRIAKVEIIDRERVPIRRNANKEAFHDKPIQDWEKMMIAYMSDGNIVCFRLDKEEYPNIPWQVWILRQKAYYEKNCHDVQYVNDTLEDEKGCPDIL